MDADETSAILAAATGTDPYVWVRVMALLAERDAADLDADALYEAIQSARLATAPPEVNALRALDAAGAVVRAQHAFSDERGRSFERRFAEARQLLATRAAQHGYDVSDPATAARQAAMVSKALESAAALATPSGRRSGCAVVVGLVVFLAVAAAGAIGIFATKDAIESAVPDVRKAFEQIGGQYGLPLSREGVAMPLSWRTVVEPTQTCRYAVGSPAIATPIERGTVVRPPQRRSIVVHLAPAHMLYAEGCSWMPATPPVAGAAPYEGDFIVGTDVPPGDATVSAGDGICRSSVRRYKDGGVVELASANVVPGQSTSYVLRPAPGEVFVLAVEACAVRVLG